MHSSLSNAKSAMPQDACQRSTDVASDSEFALKLYDAPYQMLALLISF